MKRNDTCQLLQGSQCSMLAHIILHPVVANFLQGYKRKHNASIVTMAFSDILNYQELINLICPSL